MNPANRLNRTGFIVADDKPGLAVSRAGGREPVPPHDTPGNLQSEHQPGDCSSIDVDPDGGLPSGKLDQLDANVKRAAHTRPQPGLRSGQQQSHDTDSVELHGPAKQSFQPHSECSRPVLQPVFCLGNHPIDPSDDSFITSTSSCQLSPTDSSEISRPSPHPQTLRDSNLS